MSIKLVDFKDIQDAILEELKIQSADTTSLARIKRVINEVYINEVVPHARWKWLEGNYQVRFNAAYFGGTASVTPNSTTVTLSTAPSVGLGSFANQLFSTNGFNEIYTIESHTAGSTTLVLSQQYLGVLDTAASFKIWTDKVNLPPDCRETVTVWHNMSQRPMEGLGQQKFRETTLRGQKAEGYPAYYFTGDYYDPSTSDGETESDRYRQMRVYPAINNKSVTISVDYIKEVTELSADGDEPVLPLEDRIVIKYGALKTLWRSLMRNPDEAMIAAQEYQMKIDRMSGKIEDSQDKPRIHPDSQYVRRRRAGRYRVGSFSSDIAGSGGGGGTFGQITYLEDVTINGGTITNNISVAAGKTIDGVDISALKTSFDNYVISDTTPPASSVIVVPTGNISSADVQSALEEIQTDIDDHIAATTAAHAASAVSNTPSGNLAATDVQAALDELQSDVDTRALDSSLTNHLSDTTDAHDASAISSIASGNLDATDVQAALDELQSDIDTRVVASAATITSALTMDEVAAPSTPASGKFAIYPKSDGKLYTKNDAGTETEVGAGGSSGINYIDNPDAESDTSGYTAYADAAATSPVDGTGGSPTVTITRSTSSPLRGVASFIITKDAANRQGEGVSYDFTIDSADKYKVLQGSLDYAIGGTYADDDLSVWIYDVTNAKLIQPAPYLLKNHSLPSERMPFEFQCSDSTSYRLIIHVGSTSTSAYTAKFDNVVVGPQAKLYGSPITDWVAYTPTVSNLPGTINKALWRRVGDSMELFFQFTASGSATAQISVSLPSGYNLDTTKFGTAGDSVFGFAECSIGASAYTGSVIYSSATAVRFLGPNTANTWSATTPSTWVNGSAFTFQANIPIQGFSSAVIMSSDANTRVVAARYSTTGGVTSWGATAVIPYTSREYDTHGAYNTTTGLYTVQVPGFYRVTNQFFGTTNFTYTYLGKNGSSVVSRLVQSSSSGQSASITIEAKAGDTLGVYNTTSSVSSVDGAAYNSVSFEKLSGPAQIAASESVSCSYTTSSQALGNGTYDLVKLTTKEWDSHNAYSSSTGLFTCPVSGIYNVTCSVDHGARTSAVYDLANYIYVNGSAIGGVNNYNGSTTIVHQYNQFLTKSVRCLAGDTISLVARAGYASTSLNGSQYTNMLSITKVGNY